LAHEQPCEWRVVAAEGCSTKVPALAEVQNAEAFPAESLTKILGRFSTEFSTLVLKTFRVLFAAKKSRPNQGRP
jgi:hypothetical protein